MTSVLGSILVVIIKLIVITCCLKQRKEARRRDRAYKGNFSTSENFSVITKETVSQAFTSFFFHRPSSHGVLDVSPMVYSFLSSSLSRYSQFPENFPLLNFISKKFALYLTAERHNGYYDTRPELIIFCRIYQHSPKVAIFFRTPESQFMKGKSV